MVKLIAIYRKPENTVEFDQHYFGIHTPLVEKVPELVKLKVNKVYGGPMGESDLYLIAEMFFETKESLANAMRTPEMRAAGKDLMGFAGKLVSMHFAEVV